MKKILVYLLLCFTPLPLWSQESQADLLEKAYGKHSKALLYKFFDNWSNEASSNENDAPNKWVAEAHKVFVAFYQPLQPEKIGCRGKDVELYNKSAYLIVQDTLNDIYMTDSIPLTQDELEVFYINRVKQQYPDTSKQKVFERYIRNQKKVGELRPVFDISSSINSYLGIPTTRIDSNISFRPPVSFSNKKVVYLTTAYKQLLNNFLGNEHVKLGEGKYHASCVFKRGKREKNGIHQQGCKNNLWTLGRLLAI